MERILVNTPATVAQQWTQDGVAVDPGTVTLQIDRADGTNLVAAGTGTNGTGTAARSFNLTTTHTAVLDSLKATWTSTTKGVLVSYIEIVGGYLCTLADIDAVIPAGLDAAKVRTDVEQRVEKILGYACVPRYERRQFSNYGLVGYRVRPNVRTIRTFTVAGAAYTTDQIAALQLDAESGVIFTSGWMGQHGHWVDGEPALPFSNTATIGYEHGLDHPDSDITRATVLAATELYGTSSGVSGGATVQSQTADNMSVTYRAPAAGDVFVNSELNSILNNNRLAGVA